ncbi:MAG: DUF1186 domain-containing protein [Bacillota bacterium]
MDYLLEIKKEFPKIKPYNENDWEWENEANDFLKKGELEKAENLFKKLCLSQPQHHAGFEGLAYTYSIKSEKSKAQWFMQEAIKRAEEFLKDNSIDKEVIDEMKENLKKINNEEKINIWENNDLNEDITGMKKLLNKMRYYDGKFHKEELAEIINNKDEAIPELLNIMKDVRDNYQKYLDDDYFIHLYATFLLAQFKIIDFFEIIIDIAKLPDEIAYKLYGDTITEDLGRIIASVYNGNIKSIYELIENREVDEYVREQGINSLVVLVLQGILEREEVVAYLKNLLMEKAKENDYKIITGIISGLTDLYPEEAMAEIEWAYKNHLVDETIIGLDDVLLDLNMGKEACIENKKSDKHTHLIGNINDEMGWWSCFSENKKRLKQKMKTTKINIKPNTSNKGTTIIKERKIGRNEPCPCNSGKKYKKCCGK